MTDDNEKTWAQLVGPLVRKLELAVALPETIEASWTGEGAKAFVFVLKEMAALLDHGVATVQADRDRLYEAYADARRKIELVVNTDMSSSGTEYDNGFRAAAVRCLQVIDDCGPDQPSDTPPHPAQHEDPPHTPPG